MPQEIRRVGLYARVSTTDQNLEWQVDAIRKESSWHGPVPDVPARAIGEERARLLQAHWDACPAPPDGECELCWEHHRSTHPEQGTD